MNPMVAISAGKSGERMHWIRYFYYNNHLSHPYGLSFMKCFGKILVYAKAAADAPSATSTSTSSIYRQDYHIDLILVLKQCQANINDSTDIRVNDTSNDFQKVADRKSYTFNRYFELDQKMSKTKRYQSYKSGEN